MSDITISDICPGNLDQTPISLFLYLITTLSASKCSLGSATEYPFDYGPKLKNGDQFDFIIVGSGSAGSIVASKLSENKDWRVLVLEAGGIPSASSDIPALIFNTHLTPEDWQYKTERSESSCLGFKNKQCNWPRGKMLGGCSGSNVMIYVKANKKDYDTWANLGNTGWDWESIKGYFTDIENIQSPDDQTTLGTRGLLPLTKLKLNLTLKNSFIKGYTELGIPNLNEQNPENPIGNLDVPVCIQDGIRANNGKKVLGTIKGRKNLYTSMHSMVEKVLIDSKTNTATGVLVKIGEQVLELKAMKEVIVSAGSINSPQLLMLSGIGPEQHLKDIGIPSIKHLPVGENLQDHLTYAGFNVNFDQHSIPNIDPVDMIYQYFKDRSGPLSGIGMANFMTVINTKKDSIWPNFCIHHLLSPHNDTLLFPAAIESIGFSDEISKELKKIAFGTPTVTFLPTLLNPKSRGKITLKSANSNDKPLIDAGYLTDDAGEDLQTMLEGLRFLEALLDTEPVKQQKPNLIRVPLPECDKHEYRSDNYWRCAVKHLAYTLFHPTSTCTMGPKDDGTSVVDPKLRVHGIKNLRVADASIMPLVSSGNTHAPTMMIGYKAGVMISEDWKKIYDEL